MYLTPGLAKNITFSNNPSLFSSLNASDQVLQYCKTTENDSAVYFNTSKKLGFKFQILPRTDGVFDLLLLLLPLALQPTVGFGLSNNVLPFFTFFFFFYNWHYSPLWALVCRTKSFHFFLSFSSSSSSSTIGTIAHCGLWHVEQCPSIFSFLLLLLLPLAL